MAFSLDAIVDGVTYSLSDGNPFRLINADGLHLPPIQRLTEHGPLQDGQSDLGFRIGPRFVTLTLGFQAATDAALDAHRQTLMGIFRPLQTIPIYLQVTRDAGEVRQLETFVSGPIDIPLEVTHRPGHYHRAVVQLRAADPLWLSSQQQSVSAAGSAAGSAWYLAAGSINPVNVLMYGSAPAIGEAWSYTGNLGTADSYTIATRAGFDPNDPSFIYSVGIDPVIASGGHDTINLGKWFGAYSVNGNNQFDTVLATGTQNYFQIYSGAGTTDVYRNASLERSIGGTIHALAGTPRYWRRAEIYLGTIDWETDIPLYALYNINLDSGQRTALNNMMNGSATDLRTIDLDVPVDGDMPDYPVITIQGPISSPTLTNVSAGETLNLGAIVIADGDAYTIDARRGRIGIVDANGNNKLSELDNDSINALYSFRLMPETEADAGINTLRLVGSVTTNNTGLRVDYYHRYLNY